MPVSLPGELLSLPPLTARLLESARLGSLHEQEALEEQFAAEGCTNPGGVLQDLLSVGVITRRAPELAVSTYGYRALLFISGAQGAPSDPVIDELKQLDPQLQKFELVRNGMTARFIKGLLTEPGFQRLYICSPWINLPKEEERRLKAALLNAEKALGRSPQVLVVAQTPSKPEHEPGIQRMRDIGAELVLKPTLHSKLYMREPGSGGGLSLAIVGSENLTRQKWIELGIEIRNDSSILSKLRRYFFEVFGSPKGE